MARSIRRSDHPSRPRAITCCFFSSLKTLLTLTEGIPSRQGQCPGSAIPLAGFQVSTYGRFWVSPEGARVCTPIQADYFAFARRTLRLISVSVSEVRPASVRQSIGQIYDLLHDVSTGQVFTRASIAFEPRRRFGALYAQTDGERKARPE